MPFFDYKCEDCNHQTEMLIKAEDPAPMCPGCVKPMTKLVSAPMGLDFKGMGCYKVEKWRK